MARHAGKWDRMSAALHRAATLTAVLGIMAFVAVLAGLASLGQMPWILGGVFAGSFAMAAYKHKIGYAETR